MAQTLHTQGQLKEGQIQGTVTDLGLRKRLPSQSRASVKHGQKSGPRTGILLLATLVPIRTHKSSEITALLVLMTTKHRTR